MVWYGMVWYGMVWYGMVARVFQTRPEHRTRVDLLFLFYFLELSLSYSHRQTGPPLGVGFDLYTLLIPVLNFEYRY